MIAALHGFAVRVLTTDVCLHGRRFVMVEFGLAAVVSTALAVTVAVSAFVRSSDGAIAAAGVVFFLGVAVNSVAVVRSVTTTRGGGVDGPRASMVDLALFCGATLVPGALALALRPPESPRMR